MAAFRPDSAAAGISLEPGAGEGSSLSKGRTRGGTQGSQEPPKTKDRDDPSFSWDLPPQCHRSAGLPPAPTCSVSLSPLSFSFSPLPLVSSVFPTKDGEPHPQPLSTLKKLPSFQTDASQRETELLTSCFSSSHPVWKSHLKSNWKPYHLNCHPILTGGGSPGSSYILSLDFQVSSDRREGEPSDEGDTLEREGTPLGILDG